ncbi:MAG: ABC transporter permease [Longimicrobiales bacterium]
MASADSPRWHALAAALPALGGALFVWLLFALLAGAPFVGSQGLAAYLNAAAPIGILAVPVALLMIAGEFDLSIGSIIGLCSMTQMLLVVEAGWPLGPALLASAALAVGIGLTNGLIVVRTGLPSFLVTLATLFMARGLTIAVTRLVTGRTQLGGLHQHEDAGWADVLFGTDLIGNVQLSVVWWILLAGLGSWCLLRTRFGNWILASGGASEAARNSGVPVARVKVSLFVCTALAAALVATLQVVRYDGADALRGELQEFRAIIAVVIGGTLLTGGYGSVLGSTLGALIFGMVQQGIVLTGANADWFQVLLGALLLAAVLANHTLHKRMQVRA